VTSIRIRAVLIGGLMMIFTGGLSTTASAQVVERGVQGAAVGAIIGGIVGGGRGAGTGAAIGAGVGVLSGAAEANARAQGYYAPPPPPGYAPPPPAYAPAPATGVGVSIGIAPPVLPVYDQPLCPGPGYIWTPGYWAYGDADYYWVPGTWVLPPAVGLLWTPGYWGYERGGYLWHAGYWGPHVGYYGGINYGFGYGGVGFEGGYWDHGAFFYNTAVMRVNRTVVTNVYSKTIIKNETVRNFSFNGPGGIKAQPTQQEIAWSHEQHTAPTTLQLQHQHTASTNRALFASVNHGAPSVTATGKPGDFARAEPVGPNGTKAANNAVATNGTNQTGIDQGKHRGDPNSPVYRKGPYDARGGPGTSQGPAGPRPYGKHGGEVVQGGPGISGKPNHHNPEKKERDQER
jgi:hypothetical protein